MRYVTELADGSRYISSSLAQKALRMQDIAESGRSDLIVAEYILSEKKGRDVKVTRTLSNLQQLFSVRVLTP